MSLSSSDFCDLYIVRHGNTFDRGDVVTRVGARTDLPLSVSGQTQARALGQHFSAQNIIFQTAFCSSLRRTQQTGQAILSAQTGETAQEMQALDFLCEIDYGVDENKPEAEVIARLGEDVIKAWDSHCVPPPGWDVDPGAIEAAWRDFFKAHATTPGPVLVVTSNGIARFALSAAMHLPEMPLAPKLRTGAFGHVQINGEGKSFVRSWHVRPD